MISLTDYIVDTYHSAATIQHHIMCGQCKGRVLVMLIINKTPHISAIPLFWEIWSLLCRHNGRSSVSNHQPHDCLPNRLFRRRSKNTPKLRVTGLCAGNSPETGQFPAQMASNAENVSIWWLHHGERSAIMRPHCTDLASWCVRSIFLYFNMMSIVQPLKLQLR